MGEDARAGKSVSHWSEERAVKCRDKEERQGREEVRREAGREERPINLRLRHSRELKGIS